MSSKQVIGVVVRRSDRPRGGNHYGGLEIQIHRGTMADRMDDVRECLGDPERAARFTDQARILKDATRGTKFLDLRFSSPPTILLEWQSNHDAPDEWYGCQITVRSADPGDRGTWAFNSAAKLSKHLSSWQTSLEDAFAAILAIWPSAIHVEYVRFGEYQGGEYAPTGLELGAHLIERFDPIEDAAAVSAA